MWWTSADPRGGALLLALAALACGSDGCRPAAAPDPLHDVELAQAGGADPAGSPAGPTLWVTRRAVVGEGRELARLGDGGAIEVDLRSSVPDETAQGRALALGVDGRAPFGAAWQVLREAGRSGPRPVRLLVGDLSRPSALRVCVSLAGDDRGRGEADCWGRPIGAPPARPSGPGGPDAGDMAPDPERGQDLPAGTFAWGEPLDLSVLLARSELVVRVQGRSLRALPRAGADALPLLATTLESLRRRNGWDLLVEVRVDADVPWGDAVAVVAVVERAGFGAVRLQGS